MPDYKKFSKIKAHFDSMAEMLADYENDFKGDGSNVYDEKDHNDAGQEESIMLDSSNANQVPKDKIEPGRLDPDVRIS